MTIGITFDETMEGWFSLGETEPAAGRRRGESERTSLKMHATIAIPDLDAFIDDPRHQGRLTAAIDFAPIGIGIPSEEGVFNLFSPSEHEGLKYMAYEAPFPHQDRPLYLAGKKHVHDDPGADLWSDTTTLFTKLHEGPDESGAVIGAGILRLDMGDFLKLMSTIRVTGTTSRRTQAAAVARFGELFAGQLWKIYGPSL